ncbi:hypothetical protein QBC44DRAFT_332637 [Cladorrhinum sp. PSN332]|nr:hypothetical protein QBC44DRAFT_332637 [Cladorrhinum sp. PSN332]
MLKTSISPSPIDLFSFEPFMQDRSSLVFVSANPPQQTWPDITMCPIPMPPVRDYPLRPRPAPVVNVEMYDDASTVCSESDAESNWSDEIRFARHCRQDRAAEFRVKKGEESRPIYEAWNFSFSPAHRDVSSSRKVLGFEVDQRCRTYYARVMRIPQPSEQSDLADIHLRSVKEFQDKHRRSWAGRILRGNGKTYEQHLDERCNNLPEQVQQSINALLEDRGKSTSTIYRTRTWSVVSLKEQRAFRFAQTDLTEVKPRKSRFWKKNKGPKEPLVYSLVLLGKETKVCSSEEGTKMFDSWGNPWAPADDAEARKKSRERQLQREARRAKIFPSPPSYRSGRERSVSPPSYRSPRSRYSSPPRYRVRDDPPRFRNRSRSRSVSPVALRERRAVRIPNRSVSPIPVRIRNRSPSPLPARIRVQRRDRSPDSVTDTWVSPFNRDPFSAPTPPECYTPPPAVSAYSRPSFPPPMMPPVQPFQRFPPPASMMPHPGPLPAPAVCRACQTVPNCGHFMRIVPCPRPLQATINGIPTHPPCYFCFGHQGPAPVPGFSLPTPYYGPAHPLPMPMAMPPPRPPFGTFSRPIWPVPGPQSSASSSSSSSASSRSSSRSSSPSPSHIFGWRKPQVEDCNDELSDTATEVSQRGVIVPELPADNVSVIDASEGAVVGDQAPELVRATSPMVV